MKPLEWIDGKVRFLDQTRLPSEEYFCETNEVNVIADAIKRLSIRGAPLIGIAAAYGVVLASMKLTNRTQDEIRHHILSAIDLLASTRPTAINLFWALKRQMKIVEEWNSNLSELRKKLLDEAIKIHEEDALMCEKISINGANLLSESCNILTHCNTGLLATGGRGTALGIITKAWELKKIKHVYIDETRPLLQGARLTAWELAVQKIPATIIADNTAAVLMKENIINAVIVGADRIAINGDTANKVGTYNLAVLANHHKIPFYVAAPNSTIDFSINTGREIPIEQRNSKELTEINGKSITVGNINVFSPAFDVTPNELISAIITNSGVLNQPFSKSIAHLSNSNCENKIN